MLPDPQAFQVDGVVRARADNDAVVRRLSHRDIEILKRAPQSHDAADRGQPLGDPNIILDEPVQRQLHLNEGGRGLHQRAERHGTGKIFRGGDEQENAGENGVAIDEPGQMRLLVDDLDHAVDEIAQRASER